MKEWLLTVIGAVGGLISSFFGGWDATLTLLLVLVCLDYTTGLAAAGIFHKSKKTENGALESRAGWKGLIKKVVTLALVAACHWVDIALNVNFFRDAVCIGFCANELISIVENAGLMGMPMPKAIAGAIDMLTKASAADDDSKNKK